MSSPLVRRLTTVLTLVALLCLAAPPAADAANRTLASKPRIALGSSILDEVLAWLAGFLPAPAPAARSRQEKSEIVPTGSTPGAAGLLNGESPVSVDRGGMIDPNGGW